MLPVQQEANLKLQKWNSCLLKWLIEKKEIGLSKNQHMEDMAGKRRNAKMEGGRERSPLL